MRRIALGCFLLVCLLNPRPLAAQLSGEEPWSGPFVSLTFSEPTVSSGFDLKSAGGHLVPVPPASEYRYQVAWPFPHPYVKNTESRISVVGTELVLGVDPSELHPWPVASVPEGTWITDIGYAGDPDDFAADMAGSFVFDEYFSQQLPIDEILGLSDGPPNGRRRLFGLPPCDLVECIREPELVATLNDGELSIIATAPGHLTATNIHSDGGHLDLDRLLVDGNGVPTADPFALILGDHLETSRPTNTVFIARPGDFVFVDPGEIVQVGYTGPTELAATDLTLTFSNALPFGNSNFDNVSFSLVPEPPGLPVMTNAGLLALCLFYRRQSERNRDSIRKS